MIPLDAYKYKIRIKSPQNPPNFTLIELQWEYFETPEETFQFNQKPQATFCVFRLNEIALEVISETVD